LTEARGRPCYGFIKTTTAAASVGHNQLIYRTSDSFNPKQGTAIAWAFLNPAMASEFLLANGPTILAGPGQNANFYWHFGGSVGNERHILEYGADTSSAEGVSALTSGTWYHFACSWDTVANSFKTYLDGTLLNEQTNAPTFILTPRKLMVGGDYYYAAMDYWQGAIDTLDIYGAPIGDAAVTADFDATKATYGRS
jgi:hypothetical protein